MEDYCLGQEQILSPKIDCVFKLLFGDERHKDILKDFLRHAIVLEEDELDTVSITGTELKREYPEDKHGILDVSAKTRKGVQINIEIQLLYQASMPKRTLYYWAKKYSEQLMAGQSYDELHRTVAINIVNFRMMDDGRYKHSYYVMEEASHQKLSDALEIHFMELPKLPNKPTGDGLTEWLMFINSENKGVMDMLAEGNKEIKRAMGVLELISRDKALRAQYLSRQMYIHDAITNEKHAREEGREEGVGIGRVQERNVIIHAMSQNGADTNFISSVVGLPVDEVRKILDAPEQ